MDSANLIVVEIIDCVLTSSGPSREFACPTGRTFQIADIFLKDEFIEDTKEIKTEEQPTKNDLSENAFAGKNIKLADYIGSFYCQELDFTYELYIIENDLVVKIGSYEPMKLTPFEENNFIVEGDGLVFRFIKEDEKLIGFELDAGRVKNLKFVKK